MFNTIQRIFWNTVILNWPGLWAGAVKDLHEAPKCSSPRVAMNLVSSIRMLAMLVLLAHCTYSQAQLPAKLITEAMFADQREQLSKEFGVNKSIPKDFELASLISLSQYPELIELRIDIEYRKIKTTMEARPTVWSVFKRKAKRRYIVVINSNEAKLKKAALKNVPFDAQIGVLAHEFAHIRMYNTKNVFGLIGIAISYTVSKKYREKFEKENDRETIKRGFGDQVYHFTYYILNETDVSEKYKAYKRRIYYEPEEVMELIKEKP